MSMTRRRGGAGLTSVSLFASTSSSTSSLAYPGSITAGDVAVVLVYRQGTESGSNPSGFTNIASATTGSGDATTTYVLYKILDGSETGSVSVITGATNSGSAMLVFRGNAPITTVTPGTFTVEVSGIPAPSNQVVTVGSTTPLAVVAVCGASGTAGFGTWSPAYDAQVVTTKAVAAYKIYNSSPSNVTVVGSDGGNANAMASGRLVFS